MACRLPAIGETPLLISQRLLANKARHLDGFKASELSLPHSPVSKSGAVLLVRVRLSLAARRHPARPDTEAKGDAHATESYEGKALASLAILATPPPARLQRPAKAHRAANRGSREALGCLPMRVGAVPCAPAHSGPKARRA